MMGKREIFIKWGIPVACAVAFVAALWGYMVFFRVTFGIGDTVYLYVDADDTPDSVRVKLKVAARPGNSSGFDILSALAGYDVKSGRYAVKPRDNMFSVFRRLRQGRQTPVRLTIPSVRTTDKLAGVLGKKLMMDSARVAQCFADSAFCHRHGYDTATIVSLFIPNTYEMYWDTSVEDFMQRMRKENATFWNAERMRKAETAGLTPIEVVTLASIVDEETANDAEKPMVAGMYINRLRVGMPLQADPTVKFALRDFSLRRIRRIHLDVDSPYNTYRNVGLPPGPIRIPSVVGIDAVLDYVRHDYLFMCAKADFSGTHNFARTYREHLANAARYAKALDDRGIE